MKTKLLILVYLVIAWSIIILLVSCEKDEPVTPSPIDTITEIPEYIGKWKSTYSYNGESCKIEFYIDSVVCENIGQFGHTGTFQYQFSGDTVFLKLCDSNYYHIIVFEIDENNADVYEFIESTDWVIYEQWYKMVKY